jgi:hypothetical protein
LPEVIPFLLNLAINVGAQGLRPPLLIKRSFIEKWYKLLAGVKVSRKGKKAPRGQLAPWGDWEANSSEIVEVADKFVFANCFNPQVAGSILQKNRGDG